MHSTEAGISKSSRSVRTKTWPVSGGAGRRRRRTGTAVCSPRPLVSTGAAMVVCLIKSRL
jgi:hypothetical protein